MKKKECPVKDRLIEFIKSQNISQRKFQIKTGLSNGFVNNIKDGIGADKMYKISQCYPFLNTDWIISGKGNMIKDMNIDSKKECLELDKQENNISIPVSVLDIMNKQADSLARKDLMLQDMIEMLKKQIDNSNVKPDADNASIARVG